MKALIPYRKTHNSEIELKFAIRSMVKFFTPMSGLIVVGDKPKWYKGDHLYVNDIIGRIDFNMYRKLIAGAKGETVLYTTDDQFALESFDETLPNYYNGTCDYWAKNAASWRHRKQYQNCPGEWLNFDLHYPMVIDTSRFKLQEPDRPIKTAYGNQNNLIGVEIGDCKIQGAPTYEELKEFIKGKSFFSTSPNSGTINKLLEQLYSEKTVYE